MNRDTGYPPDGNWDRWEGSKLFVRMGAIIHGRKWKRWDERLKRFKNNRGLNWDAEIKASHIRRGKDHFVGWDRLRRDLCIII